MNEVEQAASPQCIQLLKESIQHMEEPIQEEANYIFIVLGASVSLFWKLKTILFELRKNYGGNFIISMVIFFFATSVII